MRFIVDPPEGWKYGFPKEYPEGEQNMTAWLIANGYPQALMDSYGQHFYCRFWQPEDDTETELDKA